MACFIISPRLSLSIGVYGSALQLFWQEVQREGTGSRPKANVSTDPHGVNGNPSLTLGRVYCWWCHPGRVYIDLQYCVMTSFMVRIKFSTSSHTKSVKSCCPLNFLKFRRWWNFDQTSGLWLYCLWNTTLDKLRVLILVSELFRIRFPDLQQHPLLNRTTVLNYHIL